MKNSSVKTKKYNFSHQLLVQAATESYSIHRAANNDVFTSTENSPIECTFKQKSRNRVLLKKKH